MYQIPLNALLKTLAFKITVLMSVFLSSLPAQADMQWLSAYDAARQDDYESLEGYKYSMQSGIFAMYPEYWQLNSSLALGNVQMVANFAQNHWQTVMGEKLAADFAEAKAEVGDYAAVRQIAPFVTNADRSEACAIALGENGGGDAMAAIEQKDRVWLAVERQPELCNKLGYELLDNPLISTEDKKQKLRVLLRADKSFEAQRVAERLGLYGVTISQLEMIKAAPSQYLMNAPVNSEQDKMLYLYALARYAQGFTTNMAAQQLAQDAGRLDATTLQYGYRILGMISMDEVVENGFSETTGEWFGKSVGTPFSYEEAEDYGRAAARLGDWQGVLHAVNGMSPAQQGERMWQYWFARASEMQPSAKSKQAAKAFYNSLILENDYYGLLARDRLGLKLNKLPSSYTPTQADYNRMAASPHFNRAFELRNMAAPASFANREWNWAVRDAKLKGDDAMILAAASQALNQNWYDRAIYAADNTITKKNMRMAYPTPYESLVKQYSWRHGIDPAWAYGIMRQESRFQMAARSHVGAGGLMQIMPGTGKLIARKLGERYSKSKLTNTDTNIRWGTFYLSDIQADLQGQPVLATAGYNAGPNRARAWQPSWKSIPAEQYIEGIPFNETRDYVKHVMTNAVHYALLFGQGPQSISERMGQVPPVGYEDYS